MWFGDKSCRPFLQPPPTPHRHFRASLASLSASFVIVNALSMAKPLTNKLVGVHKECLANFLVWKIAEQKAQATEVDV